MPDDISKWKPVDESAWKPVGDTRPVDDGGRLVNSTTPQSTMAPAPKPAGLFPRIAEWGKDLGTDLRSGTGLTLPGRALHAIGARPLQEGVSPEAAEYLGSPLLGAAKVTQGIGEIGTPGQRWLGAGHIVGGGLQAAALPLSVIPEGGPAAVSAPEIAARGTEGLAAAGRGIASLFPSAKRSGQALSDIENLTGHHPIDITAPGEAALRSFQLAREGNPAPAKPIRDFLSRTTAPDRLTAGGAEITHPPLTFGEGRNLYSAGRGRLATDEMTRLNGKQVKALGDFTNDLGTSLSNTAAEHGQGEQYAKALAEYRHAKQLQSGLKTAGKVAGGAAVAGAGVEGARRILSPLVGSQ
jgi:hypothetical protein